MKVPLVLLTSLPSIALAQATGWGSVAQPAEEVFSLQKWWTEPLFSGFWMAWTRATLAFFIFIFAFIFVMAIIEIKRPGGGIHTGVFGLETTRGDRLFIGLLGSAYIFLMWLGFVGALLWVAAGLAVAWIAFCFWKV